MTAEPPRASSGAPVFAAFVAVLAMSVGVNAAYRRHHLGDASMAALSVASGLVMLVLALALRRARLPTFPVGTVRRALVRSPWMTGIVVAMALGAAFANGTFGAHGAMWYVWTADAVVLVPLAEETFFRGTLQTALNESRIGGRRLVWGLQYGTIAGAVLFAGAHVALIAAGVALPRVWFEVGSALPLGLIVGLIYQRTGNLWYGILIHAAGNLGGA